MPTSNPNDPSTAAKRSSARAPSLATANLLAHSDVYVDARPIIPRIPDGIFSIAQAKRDALFQAATRELAGRKIKANVIRSGLHEYPMWVSIQCWMPADKDGLVTARSTATITLNLKPYHRFEIEYIVRLEHRGTDVLGHALREFGQPQIAAIVDHLVGSRRRPTFRSIELRRFSWQFWKPENKTAILGRDWARIGVSTLAAIGLITMIWCVGIAFLIAALIGAFLLWRRDVYVRSSGKPVDEPRSLLRVDGWQAVAFALGEDIERVRARLTERFQTGPGADFRWKPETIWYWGIDGVVEREQLVLTLRRAILFLHIERYEKDLYVGWDAHVNRGQWVEVDVKQGIDKTTGRLSKICVATPGIQAINEYDVNDCNCLIEWAHAQLTQLLREILAERKLSQEIDFKIIRGERQTLTSQQNSMSASGAADASVGQRVRSMFTRLS